MSVSPGTTHAVAGHVATGSCVWHAGVLVAVMRCPSATAACLSRARSCRPIQNKRATSPTRDRVPASCLDQMRDTRLLGPNLQTTPGNLGRTHDPAGAKSRQFHVRIPPDNPAVIGAAQRRSPQEPQRPDVRRSLQQQALLPYGGPKGSVSCYFRLRVQNRHNAGDPVAPLVLRRHGSDLPLPPKARHAVLFWSG